MWIITLTLAFNHGHMVGFALKRTVAIKMIIWPPSVPFPPMSGGQLSITETKCLNAASCREEIYVGLPFARFWSMVG